MKATTHTTRTGRKITVRLNHSQRTATIKCSSGKYRTIRQSKEEFANMKYMSGDDWNYFLKSNDYYQI